MEAEAEAEAMTVAAVVVAILLSCPNNPVGGGERSYGRKALICVAGGGEVGAETGTEMGASSQK